MAVRKKGRFHGCRPFLVWRRGLDSVQKYNFDWRWWLMPVILVTQKAEIRRIMVQSQCRQVVRKTLP
jgi:hypothetical protein